MFGWIRDRLRRGPVVPVVRLTGVIAAGGLMGGRGLSIETTASLLRRAFGQRGARAVALSINSPGGSVTAGLAIYDTMQFIKPEVSTLCIGQAASMGSVIACSGTKGRRFALPHAENLMHQPLIGGVIEGQATDLEIHAKHILRLRDKLYTLYSENTGQTKQRIHDDCDRDKWLNAQEMLEYGLIDKVLDRLPGK